MSIFRYDKRKFAIKVFYRKQKHETKYKTISYYLILPTHPEISSSYNDFEVSVVPLPNFDV
jgi:Ni,Fe-hydrogenase I cytochrome b subunit